MLKIQTVHWPQRTTKDHNKGLQRTAWDSKLQGPKRTAEDFKLLLLIIAGVASNPGPAAGRNRSDIVFGSINIPLSCQPIITPSSPTTSWTCWRCKRCGWTSTIQVLSRPTLHQLDTAFYTLPVLAFTATEALLSMRDQSDVAALPSSTATGFTSKSTDCSLRRRRLHSSTN